MVKEMTKDFEADRSREDGLIMEALGQKVSFEEYLQKDKNYAKVREQNSNSNS